MVDVSVDVSVDEWVQEKAVRMVEM